MKKKSREKKNAEPTEGTKRNIWSKAEIQNNQNEQIKKIVDYAKQITLLTINEQNGTQLRRAFFMRMLLAIDGIKRNI